MNLNRIDTKLGGTIVILFLVVLLPLGFVMNQVFSGFYYTKVKDETNQFSSQYANLIANNRDEMTVQMVIMMAQFSQVKLFIVNQEGKIVAISNLPHLSIGETVTQNTLETLLLGQSYKSIEEDIEGKRYYSSGTPIIINSNFFGGVFVLSPIQSIDESIKKVTNLLILSGIGAFFLTLGFTLVISRKLSHPLIQMEKASRKIAKGDLNTKVEVTSGDEMGSLAVAINDLAKDLKRYRDSRREFFANISHELRTPLTYLDGYSNVLKEELYETEEEKRKYLDIIQQETKRLTQLINDLFELSKIEEGKLNLNKELIDLTDILERVIVKIGLKAKQKGLTLENNLGVNDIPLLYGDGFRLEQVFLNLLENAVRYTTEGTVFILIEYDTNKKYISIVIKDTGKGIPEEELPFIFDRFYRVEKSRSREFGGSGLGLSIVKDLVEMHQGTINVTSDFRLGTRFEIKLPVPGLKEKGGGK